MKTLKKTLCMVLAVVMVVGVLILPASADDAADKKAANQKADYETLELYGIMHGRDGGAEALDEYVRRDEVATIVYRIMTGDNTEDGKMAGNFKAAATAFTDVATTNWAAGFIGYTAESKIFSGREGNKFDPTANVRGDELVKVMLRCLGYGVEDEYTGDGWNTRALYTAQEIGMLKGIDEEMDKPITRGAVSQIVLNAIELPMAVYYNGTYSIYSNNSGRPAAPNDPNAKENPVLVEYDAGEGTVEPDDWGIPSRTDKPVVYFNHPNKAVEYKLGEVPVEIEPVVEYYHAVTQCDLADDIGLKKSEKFTVYVNGMVNEAEITVNPLNTAAEIGAQGRHTLVYDLKGNDGKADTIVYIDTLLAEVTGVTKATFDRRNHLEDPATLNLDVYIKDNANIANTTVPVTLVRDDSKDYTYAVGDMLLVKYIQSDFTTSVSGDATEAQEILKTGGSSDTDPVKRGNNVEIIDYATSTVAAQTVIYHNQNKHNVGGTVYADNNRYHLDGAGTVAGTYTWYFDNSPEGKNVIGSKQIETSYAYGVITRIWAEIADRGETKVKAEVVYMDGTTATVEVNNVIYYTNTTDTGAANAVITDAGTDLIAGGKATYTDGETGVMEANRANTIFYVSDSWQTNKTADGENKVDTSKYAGILNDHLFRITSVSNGYNFTEVAGKPYNGTGTAGTDYNTENCTASTPSVLNGASFKGMGNATTKILKGRATNNDTNGPVEVDGNTVFLVRSGKGTSSNPYVWKTYVGFKNIVDYDSGEVDYVNTDKDDAAEYVYITADATSAADTGKHIFVSTANNKTDTTAGTWKLDYSYDSKNEVYTVNGWLDGEVGSVKVKASNAALVQAFIKDTAEVAGFNAWLVTITDGYLASIDGGTTNKAITDTTIISTFNNGVALNHATNGWNTNVPAMYKDQSVIVHKVASSPDVTVEAETVKINGVTGTFTYDVAPVYGKWDDLKKKDTVAVFVYDTDTKAISQAYIFRAASGSSYGEVTSSTTTDNALDLTLTINGIDAGKGTGYYDTSSDKSYAAALTNAKHIKLADFNIAAGANNNVTVADGSTDTRCAVKIYANLTTAKAAATTTAGPTITGTTEVENCSLAAGNYIVVSYTNTNSYYTAYVLE